MDVCPTVSANWPDGVWKFAETKPISTYITAFVAGPYHYVTDSTKRVFEDVAAEIPSRDVQEGARAALRRRRRVPW